MSMTQISLPRSFLLSVDIALIFLLSLRCQVIAHSASPELFVIIDNAQALGWLLAALLCLVENTLLIWTQVCFCCEANLSGRSYQQARSQQETSMELHRHARMQFDPQLLTVFEALRTQQVVDSSIS